MTTQELFDHNKSIKEIIDQIINIFDYRYKKVEELFGVMKHG